MSAASVQTLFKSHVKITGTYSSMSILSGQCFSSYSPTESPGWLDKTPIARPIPRVSDWAGLWWSLRICNSEKIPGDTDATGLGTCFENLDLGHWKAIRPHNVTVQVYTGQHFQNLRNPEPRVSLELCQKLNFRYPSQRHVSKVRGGGEHPLKHKTFGK